MLCVAPVKWLRYFLATMIVRIWSKASVGRVLKIGQIWDFGRTDWTPLHFSDASLFSLSLGFRGIITPFMGRRKKTHLCRLTQSWNDYSLPPGEWRSLMPTPPDVLVSFATGACTITSPFVAHLSKYYRHCTILVTVIIQPFVKQFQHFTILVTSDMLWEKNISLKGAYGRHPL